MGMPLKRLIYLIQSDLIRYHGQCTWTRLLKDFFLNRGFKATLFYRIGHYLYQNNRRYLLKLFNLFYFRLQSAYCFELPYQTKIGPGFYFGHVFGTIINRYARIGKNVNISHGVTIGVISHGPRRGCPVIKDNVYIAPGAKIIGKVRIAEGTAIGANAVVTKDTPENAVVVGNPGEVVSQKGAWNYLRYPVERETTVAQIPTPDMEIIEEALV